MVPENLPTPAYVYDLAEVRRSWALLTGALPAPSWVYYSLKANPHPDVLTTLREAGAGAEVCSAGELAAAVGAGFRPDRIVYTGPGKRSADIDRALRAGVREFSVDSPAALDQVDAVAARNRTTVSCLLRINDDRPVPGQGVVMTGVPSPFGADLAWVEAEPERFRSRPHVDLAGLHLYMGSNIGTEHHLLGQFDQALDTVVRLGRVLGTRFGAVNLGGGFGAPFARDGALPRFPTLAARLARRLDEATPGWRDGAPRILFESGRYLTATCGSLLVRVLDVKQSHGRRVVVLESGVNHLGGMSGLRRLPQVVPDLVTAPDAPAGSPALVTGPLCTPLDVWARQAELPEVRPGDLVTVRNVGAYGLHASLVTFLGHPFPAEIAVDGDRIRSMTRLTVQRQVATLSEG